MTRTDLAAEVFRRYLPAALADGRHRASPSAQVQGHELEHLQPASDRLRRGVSGAKLVVTL